MRIIVNIPKDYKETELIINIGCDEALPFDDAMTNEEAVEELSPRELENLNMFSNYVADNMGSEVEIYDDTVSDEFGGDIEVG